MYFLFAMERRTSGTPLFAVVQKYSNNTQHYGAPTGFTTANMTGGIKVTLPTTYCSVVVLGVSAFEVEALS